MINNNTTTIHLTKDKVKNSVIVGHFKKVQDEINALGFVVLHHTTFQNIIIKLNFNDGEYVFRLDEDKLILKLYSFTIGQFEYDLNWDALQEIKISLEAVHVINDTESKEYQYQEAIKNLEQNTPDLAPADYVAGDVFEPIPSKWNKAKMAFRNLWCSIRLWWIKRSHNFIAIALILILVFIASVGGK